MTKPSKIRFFMLTGLFLGLAWGFYAYFQGQNEAAVGANVLIALDKADIAVTVLEALPRIEIAMKTAENTRKLQGLHSDQLSAYLNIADKNTADYEPLWKVIRACHPGRRTEVTSPDLTLVNCEAAVLNARGQMHKTLGTHLQDAITGAVYLEGHEADLYVRKQPEMCGMAQLYLRGAVSEVEFKTSIPAYYFNKCPNAAFVISPPIDRALRDCATDEACMGRVMDMLKASSYQ